MKVDDERVRPEGLLAGSEVREDVARTLLDRMETIINDSVAIFPFSGPQPLEMGYCEQLGQLLLQLLAMAVRAGRVDFRAGFITDLHRLAAERGLTAERLFSFVYVTERTTLDELALDDALGATSESWGVVAQLVRRASFDVVAAFTERSQQESTGAAITDRLTTLHSRAMMEAVLTAEVRRVERFGRRLAFIIFDVDYLSDINRNHGYGVGDRLLERLGILTQKYFRQHDWAFRYGEDSIAVLLPETSAEDALALANRVLGTVETRLGFKDYRTEQRVRVTISAALVTVQGTSGEPFDVERVLHEAEAALERAKISGRNRVECAEIDPATLSVAVAARYLGCSPTTVCRLVTEGALRASGVEPDLCLDRQTVEDYRAQKSHEIRTKTETAKPKP